MTIKTPGIGFLGLLTIVFITLKLTDYIQWAWWLVLLPVLLQPGITILFSIYCLIVWGICSLLLTLIEASEKIQRERR